MFIHKEEKLTSMKLAIGVSIILWEICVDKLPYSRKLTHNDFNAKEINAKKINANEDQYRKSSNNSPWAYLPTNLFWVGAYSSGGLI